MVAGRDETDRRKSWQTESLGTSAASGNPSRSCHLFRRQMESVASGQDRQSCPSCLRRGTSCNPNTAGRYYPVRRPVGLLHRDADIRSALSRRGFRCQTESKGLPRCCSGRARIWSFHPSNSQRSAGTGRGNFDTSRTRLRLLCFELSVRQRGVLGFRRALFQRPCRRKPPTRQTWRLRGSPSAATEWLAEPRCVRRLWQRLRA